MIRMVRMMYCCTSDVFDEAADDFDEDVLKPVGAGSPQTRLPSNLNIGRYFAPVGENRK